MSDRMRKVNEHVLHKIAESISRRVELPLDTFVTVTSVETSKDLRHANVLVMVLPDGKRASTIKKIQSQKGLIQKALAEALRMKFTPKIHIGLDETGIRAQHMYDVIDETVRRNEEEESFEDAPEDQEE